MKTIFILIFACIFSFVLPGTEAVFTASFEENFTGISRNKTVEGKVSQQLLWETLQNLLQPGVSGNAAVIGTSADKEKLYHAVYRNNGILNPREGTISFYVKPLNWNGDDRDFHVLFQASGPDATLLIYKYINSGNLMFLLGPSRPVNGKYVWTMAGTGIKKWKAGTWHHIAAAYDSKTAELFVDGKRVSKLERKALPEKEFTQFSAGAISPKQWKTPLGLTLLDELQIFDKKLSYGEITALSSKCVKVAAPEIRETATIVNRQKNELDLYFTIEGAAAKAEVKFSGKDKVLFRKEIRLTGAQNKWTIALNSLKPGVYPIDIAGLDAGGKVLCKQRILFELPKLPEAWKNNQLGLDQRIPAPWSPLELDRKHNRISGKMFTYDFSKSFLPVQITANGTKLFSRPAELRINGRKVEVQAIEHHASAAGTRTFSAQGKCGKFMVNTQVQCSYDGFTWVRLELSPERTQEIYQLQLDFPFLKSSSTLFNSMNKFYMNYQKGHCGDFRNYNMNLYKRPPVMFVGNDSSGMQWFCEKLPCWYNQDPEKALQLISRKNENLLRLNLIDKKIQAGQTLVYEFGFQSVPMRPMPENWRAWCPYRNFDPYFVWSKYHHYPYADAQRTDAAYTQLFRNKSSRFGKQLFYYFAGFTITPTFPEWPYYSSEWMLTPPELGLYGCIGKEASYFTWICPGSREYQDFYLDRLHTLVKKLDIPNIYIDNSDAQMCDNPRHGCGYRGTDGKRYSSFNLIATRTLAMRIYKMFKEMRPDGRIIRHMSAKPVAPVVAFADMIVDGELYNKTVAMDESYFNIFDPAMFRASFRGTLWGIPQFFIPQFTRVIPGHNPKRWHAWKTPEARLKQMDKIRHFKGYFLVHDTQIFQLFGVRVNDVEQLKERFGLRSSSRFICYSDAQVPWQAPEGVLVSGYVEGDKLLLIILNESKTAQFELKLNVPALRRLGVKNFDFCDAETGKTMPLSGNQFNITLQPHDYMMLWNLAK